MRHDSSPTGSGGKCYTDHAFYTYIFRSSTPSAMFKWSLIEDGVVSDTFKFGTDDGSVVMNGTASFDRPGRHTVTIKLLSPSVDQASLSFTMC